MRRVALIIAVFLVPSLADACSCRWPDELTKQYVIGQLCFADTVFVGDVESRLHVRDQTYEYKIWPRQTFRGQLQSPAYALSTVGGRCGFPFQTGGRYLIFANLHEETAYLRASICGLTRLLDRDSFAYQVLESTKDDIETICGEEETAKGRIEIFQERVKAIEELEKASRELRESSE